MILNDPKGVFKLDMGSGHFFKDFFVTVEKRCSLGMIPDLLGLFRVVLRPFRAV